MASGLEEPGWPNFPGENHGAILANAFALGASIAQRRHALEERLHEMQLRMGIQEEEHQRKIQAMNFNAALSIERMNRQSEMQGWNANLNREKFELMRDKYAEHEYQAAQKDAYRDKTTSMVDELSKLDELGPADKKAELSRIQYKYADAIANDPQAKSLFEWTSNRHDRSAMQMNQAAASIQKQIMDLAKHGTVDAGAIDSYGDEYFGKGVDPTTKAPTRFIGFDAQGKPIKPDKDGNIVGGRSWRTALAGNYETMRRLQKARDDMRSGGAATMPSPVDVPTFDNPKDTEAYQWAMKHPQDPRSGKILNRLNVQ